MECQKGKLPTTAAGSKDSPSLPNTTSTTLPLSECVPAQNSMKRERGGGDSGKGERRIMNTAIQVPLSCYSKTGGWELFRLR